eukprot:m.260769 g.260769  ORF g.260769 m.260769 type:complete len:1312 (+) comp16214_c0_seq10:98-4033(+)
MSKKQKRSSDRKWFWKSNLTMKDSNKKAWSEYDEDLCEKLDEGFEADPTATDFVLDDTYLIDFAEKLQYRKEDKDRQRPIRWEGDDQQVAKKVKPQSDTLANNGGEAAESADHHSDGEVVQHESDGEAQDSEPVNQAKKNLVASWFWKKNLTMKDTNKKAWKKYDDATSQKLTEQFLKNPTEKNFALDDTYRINFVERYQFRAEDENRQRPIKYAESVDAPDISHAGVEECNDEPMRLAGDEAGPAEETDRAQEPETDMSEGEDENERNGDDGNGDGDGEKDNKPGEVIALTDNTENTIMIQLPPFTARMGPIVKVDVPKDARPLTLWVHELQHNEALKKRISQRDRKKSGKDIPKEESKLIGLFYPPFHAGIKIPNQTPCSALACLNIVGANIATVERTADHIPGRQLTQVASLDDEEANEIDTKARNEAKQLLDSNENVQWDKLAKFFETASPRLFQATLTYLPYKPLLNAFKDKNKPWSHLLTQEELNQALLRTDWRRRQQFLHQVTPPEDLVPLFKSNGKCEDCFQTRKLSSEELEHPTYDAKNKIQSYTNTLQKFEEKFKSMTGGILEGVLGTDDNGAQVFCGGGVTIGCLTKFSQQVGNLYGDSDIDIFVSAKSLDDGKEAVQRTVKKIRANLTQAFIDADEYIAEEMTEYDDGRDNFNFNIRIMRTANAISIWSPEFRVIQVIMICYKNMEEVLQFFDLDCVCVAYDGSNVFALPRAVRALQTGYNFVEPAKLRRWSTGPRIVKYSLRGFGTVFSEICRHHPRCDLKSTLTEEMALKISSLNASTDADVDFGYNTAALGDVVLEMGSHLDKHMQKMEETVNALKQNRIFEGDERKKPPVEASLMSKFHFFYGWKSIGNANIDKAINGLKGIPPMRFKSADLWESVRGNEFLPKCYMCRARIDPVETLSERPRVCDACEFLNSSKRTQSADLSNTVAVVTGGRCRIGYATAIRLLRLGATVIVTSRFPNTTARKYALEKDWSVWKDKLFIYGLDFRHMPSVAQFTASVASQHPQINLLINNAAQTIRRPLSYTSILAKENAQPLSDEAASRIVWQSNFGALDGHHLEDGKVFSLLSLENAESRPEIDEKDDGSAQKVKAKAAVQVKAKAAVKKKVVAKKKTTDADEIARDKDGEPIDTRKTTTWNTPSLGVDPLEYLEVQFINVHAPWQIIQNLRPCLNAAGKDGKALIVNVTSAEGIFNTGGFDETQPSSKKHHAHTNMAKAALNMLTYSLASELSQTNVSVLSVDTGWVSQMVPDSRAHITSDPPLTCEDGAARVLDPFIQWAQGVYPPSGKLLRHFQIAKKW